MYLGVHYLTGRQLGARSPVCLVANVPAFPRLLEFALLLHFHLVARATWMSV